MEESSSLFSVRGDLLPVSDAESAAITKCFGSQFTVSECTYTTVPMFRITEWDEIASHVIVR